MRSVASIVLATALVLGAAVAAPAHAAPSSPAVPAAAVTAAAPAVTAAAATLTIKGRGYGHGRGMGQYGSLGYAVDYGWSSAAILNHFYGGTTASTVPNNPIGVELLAQRNRAVAMTGTGLAVDGVPTGTAAVLVDRVGANTLRVRTGPSCGGPWSTGTTRPAGLTVTSGPSVGICEVGQVRGYRGNLKFVEANSGMSVVNQLPVEQYLRGVVPRESPASWADAGGGRGKQALQAQSVAARSYALSATYASYATTCDTTACQVYRGAWTRSLSTGTTTSLEDPRTDAAIAATAGVVRRTAGGAIARTEFSSSTGGWSAGGTFPAVQDLGDATTANPNRTWQVSMAMTDVAARLRTGPISDIRVTRRNGLGADGGRVLEVKVTSGTTTSTFTGLQVRTALGLKSDWFTLSGFISEDTANALVQALWRDLLGRAPTQAERDQRVAELMDGRSTRSLALEVARSKERAQTVVVGVYQQTLDRTPREAEIQGWIAKFSSEGSIPALQASILASEEAWLRSGKDPRAWVDRMYRATLGRSAAAWEQDFWAARIPTQGRYSVALGIAGSLEAAHRRLNGYYKLFLGRSKDPGADVHIPPLLGTGPGDLTIPAALVSSPEYLMRATRRF
jgi:SpoIID/LytB domain protein